MNAGLHTRTLSGKTSLPAIRHEAVKEQFKEFLRNLNDSQDGS